MDYQKKKLLADCYEFLKPSRALLEKYLSSLDDARRVDEISEEKYLFLRSHRVVLDSLMDVTQGDYAHFNSHTYHEVYEDIQSKALKQYNDEAEAHKETCKELERANERIEIERQQHKHDTEELMNRIQQIEEHNRQKRERKITICGRIATGIFVIIPYGLMLVVLEMIKMQIKETSWKTALVIGCIMIATAIDGLYLKYGRIKVNNLVRQIIEKHDL